MRSRNGTHKISQSLSRRVTHYATRTLAGAHRPRGPDELHQLSRILTQYLRIARRMEKRDPHLFGPRARDYFLDTLRVERQQEALHKIYGPPDPSQPARVSTLWTDRYHFSSPSEYRKFLKWFREQYPSS